MKEYTVMFNNGHWEDIISFTTKSSSKKEALENILKDNPEYSCWYTFIS